MVIARASTNPQVAVADVARTLLSRRRAVVQARDTLDIVDFAESNYWIPNPLRLIRLLPHQKGLLRIAFTRAAATGHYPYSLVLCSAPKKAGKSSLMGIPVRYVAETQSEQGEIYALGNDLKQARDRSFKFARQSITLSPGYRRRQGHSGEGVLPDRWDVQKGQMACLATGTIVEALGIDPEGEAGGNPDLSVWTELWGARHEDEIRMWEEMVPPPTKPDSMRIVETYAGFTGVSVLLEELYTKGKQGRRMLLEEFARRAHREKDGERYEDFLHAFDELEGDPNEETPIWVNEAAGMLMYWDSGVEARRMPWQRSTEGAAYYAEQESQVPPAQFSRQHLNEWVGAEGEFVPITLYDARMEELPPFDPRLMGKGTPGEERVVLGVDAAVSKDCFGIVAVTRHPDPARRGDSIALRAARKWDPKDTGGVIDFRGPEAFIRTLCQGGCVMGHPQYGDWIDPECWACQEKALTPAYMVIQVAYDPHQLEDMMQRLRRERVVWTKPFLQTKDRLVADSRLHDLITQGRFAHPGVRVCAVCGDRGCERHEDYRLVAEFPAMREHMLNANMKLQPNEDSKMRIIKRAESAKVDLVVSLSMAADRALRLQL